jgi:hypothetical protein
LGHHPLRRHYRHTRRKLTRIVTSTRDAAR